MRAKRVLVAALAAGLLLSGCRATDELAREWRELVSVGMTQDEVFQELGSPSVVQVDAGPPLRDVWTYRVISKDEGTPLRYVGTVLLVAVFAVLIVAAAKGGGNIGGGWGGGGGGGGKDAESLWEFTVTFNPAGRVSAVSEIRRIR